LTALAVTLLGTEIALRLLGAEVYRFVHEARQIHRYDRAWRVAPRPGTARYHLTRPALSFDVTLDADGRRVPSRGDVGPGPAPYVHAIGDSFTMGWGVPFEASYPARLGGLLAGRASVLNLGLDGFGAIAATEASTRLLDRYPPAAVIYLFSANDLEDDARAVANAARPAAWHLAMEGLDAMRRRSYVADTPFAVKWLVYFRRSPAPVTGGGPATIEERPLPSPDAAPLAATPTGRALGVFRRRLDARGARLLVVGLDDEPTRRFLAAAARDGIESHLLHVPAALRIPGDGHLAATGCLALAERVAAWLR
jgi:hypothetical protein